VELHTTPATGRSAPARSRRVLIAAFGAGCLVLVMPINALALGRWTIVPSPNVPGETFNSLAAVSCPDPTTCVAVGAASDSGGRETNLIEQASPQTTWSIVSSPNRSGVDNQLRGVSCVSATACVAVGASSPYDAGGFGQTLIERNSGGLWQIVTSPNITGSSSALFAVSCANSATCVAVGEDVARSAIIEELSGGTWAIASTPIPSGAVATALNAVSCPDTETCFASGLSIDSSGHYSTYVVKRSGGTWSLESTPNPVGERYVHLSGISCATPTDCVTVGDVYDASKSHALVEELSGGTWTVMSTPPFHRATSPVFGISCPTASSCVLVGYSRTRVGNVPVVEVMAAGAWKLVHPPHPTAGAIFAGVSCLSAATCVAVGYTESSADPNVAITTFVEQAPKA
jgi:hypothetical protein